MPLKLIDANFDNRDGVACDVWYVVVVVKCWNFSWLNCVDLACVLGQFEGYNANLREFPEQVVRCVPAKPAPQLLSWAQCELKTPAEVWLALLPPTIRSFRQSASKGKHTLQDDILNLSAFLLNGLTVRLHSKWDLYCQTMRGYLQISRWHKYSSLIVPFQSKCQLDQ